MLEIYPEDKTKLDKIYHFPNNICAHIYDQLTEIFNDKCYLEMTGTAINLTDQDNFAELLKQETHILDALKISDRKSELEIVLAKHLTMSLLADMANFIYEAIHIAQKGKMTVAYALLRKPFTDQLCMLEQLLTDRTGSIDRFFHDGTPSAYDPSAVEINKLALIKNSMALIDGLLLQEDFIYEIRYDQGSKLGISSLSNQALHMVTNHRKNRTQPQNLNMIFNPSGSIDGQWSRFYTIVPMLMIYTASVVDGIVFGLIPNKDKKRELKMLRRFIGTILLFNDADPNPDKSFFKPLAKLQLPSTKCKICKHTNRITKTNLITFFYKNHFYCRRCQNVYELCQETIDRFAMFFSPKHRDAAS